MELELIHYILAILAGFVAAIMNTLAGFGSIITLTFLMDVIGLPSTLANGTNRVSILSMSIAGTTAYHKNGKLNIRGSKWLLIFTFLGAILGVALAVVISPEQFKAVFKYLLLLIFIVVLVNPKRWVHEYEEAQKLPIWKIALLYFPIGFYGGFIQMGMGVVFLMAAVLVSHYTIVRANALKLVAVFFYTVMSLAIFHYHGLVDWKIGSVLAIGQAIGGYLTATYASRIKNANLYAYRVLIVIVLVVIFYQFGIVDMLF